MTTRPRSPDGYYEWHEETKQWMPVPPPEQPPAPRARSKRRWPIFLAVGVGALFLMGLCVNVVSSAGKAATKSTPVPTPAQVHQEGNPAQAAAPARDGSCAPKPCQNDSYGWIVSVSNLKYDAPGGFGGQHPAEPGSVFVTMDLTFTNKLATEQHANSTEFVLKDANGVKHSTTMVYTEACPGWSAVNLTQGASFGPRCIAFEAAAGKPSPLVLTWSPHFGVDYDIPLS